MKLITISVPAYNEQESIATLYETVVNVMDTVKDKYTFELLFINDGSKDNTLEIVKQLHTQDERVGFVDLSRNYGKEIAMAAGFDYAKGGCCNYYGRGFTTSTRVNYRDDWTLGTWL